MSQPHPHPDPPTDLTAALGLGVAGNFTGHLEQAGEASDFVDVAAAAGAPKGVFPFYLPGGGDHFLHTFPLSADTIEHPGEIAGRPAQLQIEPELALFCELTYDQQGVITAVNPTHVTAYNDCSTRRPDATKISQKKNWGPRTKGLASDQWIALDQFAPGGMLDHFRLACLLRRDGQLLVYGEDSPVAGPKGYGYMYRQLLDWLIDRLNHQEDQGPLENLAQLIAAAGRPRHAVIAIGATRYTPLGESTFLQPDDESIVVAYDSRKIAPASIFGLVDEPPTDDQPRSSAVLAQRVIPRGTTSSETSR